MAETGFLKVGARTGERGSAVGAARGGGIVLIPRELPQGEGRLVGVTESRRLVPFALRRDGQLGQQVWTRALVDTVRVCGLGQRRPGTGRMEGGEDKLNLPHG